MLNKEVLDLIMKRLGNRTAATLRATVLIELNNKISQLEQGDVLPWFLQDIWLGQTVASQDYVDVISDYLRDDDEGQAEINDTTVSPAVWSKFTKTSYGKLREKTANCTAQLPALYAVHGEKVYFGPAPNQVYSFRVPYYKRSTSVADNTQAVSNKWLLNFFNFVTLDTIDFVARTHTRDNSLVAAIAAELQQAQRLFDIAVEARIHAGRGYLLDDSES
jgi:hypothetical protein